MEMIQQCRGHSGRHWKLWRPIRVDFLLLNQISQRTSGYIPRIKTWNHFNNVSNARWLFPTDSYSYNLLIPTHLITDIYDNWAMGCWHGYLPGARCRLAYGPADANATHCLCFSKIQIGFIFLVPAHLGIPGKTSVCIYDNLDELTKTFTPSWLLHSNLPT